MRRTREQHTEWEDRRRSLNHDWLRNRFLPAIAHMRNVQSGALEEDGFAVNFVDTTLLEWSMYRETFRALVASFEESMSPCNLISCGPLQSMPEEDKAACARLAHELWLSRYPVEWWINEAKSAYDTASAQWGSVNSVAQRLGPDGLTPNDLDALYAAFADLARAIERFPHRMLVMEGL